MTKLCKNYDTCDNSHKHCTVSCEDFVEIGEDSMKFYCTNCEELFDEDDLYIWYEDRGYYGSEPVSEQQTGCPYCSNSVIEATVCEKCKEEIPSYSITCGICSKCIDDILLNNDVSQEYINDDIEHFIDWWKDHGGLVE